MAGLDYIKYWNNTVPKCPHCDEDFDVWEGDNATMLDYEDGGHTTFECAACRKEFVAVTAVRYEFSTAVDSDAAYDDEWGPRQQSASA